MHACFCSGKKLDRLPEINSWELEASIGKVYLHATEVVTMYTGIVFLMALRNCYYCFAYTTWESQYKKKTCYVARPQLLFPNKGIVIIMVKGIVMWFVMCYCYVLYTMYRVFYIQWILYTMCTHTSWVFFVTYRCEMSEGSHYKIWRDIPTQLVVISHSFLNGIWLIAGIIGMQVMYTYWGTQMYTLCYNIIRFPWCSR